MSASTCQLGQWGEGIAADFLERSGYKILIRNYHAPQGEIDIVAVSPDICLPCLVFVEVKTRSSSQFGYPEEAVGRVKWRRLSGAVQHFLAAHGELEYDWRVDVIAILGQPGGQKTQIQHYENVVMPDERN